MNRTYGAIRPECRMWLAVCCCLIFPFYVMADEATKRRFANEYPAASKFLLDRFEDVRCTFESETNPMRMRSTGRFWRSGPYEKIEATHDGQRGGSGVRQVEVIALRGHKPEFRIVRTGDEPNFVDRTQRGKDSNLRWLWQRVRIGRDPVVAIREMQANREAWYWGIMNRYEANGSAVVYAPWGGAPGRFADWLASGEATLIDASPVEGEPGTVEARIRKKEMQVSLDFVARFDTNAHWALKSMDVSVPGSGESHHRMDVEYGEPIDGVAWPRMVTIDRQLAFRISNWSFEPTPKDEFRLPYYGLMPPPAAWDEPEILAIIALAIMACVALAIRFLWRRIRRRSACVASVHAESADPMAER